METTITEEALDVVRRWAAVELAGDVPAYEPLLAQDFRGVGPVGFVLDRTGWSQRHLGDLVNEEFEILEPNVRWFGETAIVEGVLHQRTIARGRDASGEFRVVLVLVHERDSWVIANVQLSGPLIAPGEIAPFLKDRTA
ncbi:nuclear transport factor 2 family protein [Sinomonas sp. ASV322]|uniref:nuclear transport factor 2 family protein n=1 Tax=Sinomonas sp. ASV322 TaxID=3041920 RepID=UPI0027DC4005|nr:nuclear transport factor 2 family protein [Sinomonas sp. ASV322]MDQ4504028.1 nuclear transport factor 2 family protein [Sinomonas sp. ASV322]